MPNHLDSSRNTRSSAPRLITVMLPLAICLALAQVAFQVQIPPVYAPTAVAPDKVVGSVDGVPIYAKDVDAFLWQWRGSEAVQEMIEIQVVAAEAKKRNVAVSQSEVESKVAEALKEAASQLQPGISLDAQLLSGGFTKSRIYLRVQRQLLLEKMAVAGFSAGDYVKVSAITYKPAGDLTIEKALTKADEAYKLLTKGSTWQTVLAGSTSVPEIVQSGGQLGWRKTRIFPDSVVAEMKTLKVGQFTHPAQTTAGVQIFRVDAKGWDLRSEELKQLQAAYLQSAVPALEADLRSKAKIVPYKGS